MGRSFGRNSHPDAVSAESGSVPEPLRDHSQRGTSQVPYNVSDRTIADEGDETVSVPALSLISLSDEIRQVSRIVTVPLVTPDKKQWRILFDAAKASARFGNHRLAEQYVTAKGKTLFHEQQVEGQPKVSNKVTIAPTAFVDAGDTLSSVVRLGMDTNVKGVWSRNGRKILAGTLRLAQFDAYRALALQVHQGGGSLHLVDGKFLLHCRILPASVAKEPEELKLYMPAVEREPYLMNILKRIETKEWPLKRIAFIFKRNSGKVKVQLSYVRSKTEIAPGSQDAFLALENDALVLRCNGRELHLTDHLHRLRTMKANLGSIHQRIQASLGKARRYHRMRQTLNKTRNFEEWSQGPIHELSHTIIQWCQKQKAGKLTFAIEGFDLPWFKLAQQCKYKGQEAGITLVEKS